MPPKPALPAAASPPKRLATRRDRIQLTGDLRSACAMLGAGAKGVETLINLVRGLTTVNPEAASFIALYDQQSATLRRVLLADGLGDLCTEAGIPWPRLVGWAFESAITTGQHIAAMKAALALPEMVDKTIKAGRSTKQGLKDRQTLFQMTGLMQAPGAVSVVNQIALNAQNRNRELGGEAFTPFEQDVIDIETPRNDDK